MDERFRDCPKECPMEEDRKWLSEITSEMLRKLETENSRLKLQLEKVLEAFGPENDTVPCPSTVGLPDSIECGVFTECQQCWRDALDQIEEVKTMNQTETQGQLSSDTIAEMHLDGTLCEQCGEFIGEAVGHPRVCAGCEE